MVAAAVEEGSDEENDHFEGVVIFCIEHAACVIVGAETAEGIGDVGRREVDVKAVGGGLL